MRLDAATVATLARNAGFLGDDVATATAIAIVGSGGVSQYRHRILPPGCGDWQGLWAINVDEHDHLRGVDLASPQEAARAAYDLTGAHDGFGWSSHFRAGSHAAHVASCAVAATRLRARTPIAAPMAGGLHDAVRRAIFDRIRTTHARILSAPKPGV